MKLNIHESINSIGVVAAIVFSFLAWKNSEIMDASHQAELQIEKRPNVQIEFDSVNTVIVTTIHDVRLTNGKDIHEFTDIRNDAKFKFKCVNYSESLIAKIVCPVAGYNGDSYYFVREVLLNTYDKPNNSDNMRFIDSPEFAPEYILSGDTVEYTFTIDNVGLDSTGSVYFHMLILFKSQYGGIYDDYRIIKATLNPDSLRLTLDRMYVAAAKGDQQTISSRLFEFTSSPPNPHNYALSDSSIMNQQLRKLRVLPKL